LQETFKVLFDKNRNPIDGARIKRLVTDFSESYNKVVKKIIDNSTTLNRETFWFNVATLMPSFGMTRKGAFHGLKIVDGVIQDPNSVLDICWAQANQGLHDLKKCVAEIALDRRSRTIVELSAQSRSYTISAASELFDKLKWTRANGSDVGRVAATKILFAVLPEIVLPVDTAEWDNVFRTDSYGKILSIMVDEINEWERESKVSLDTLDPCPLTTVTSIYNVMAMSARPSVTQIG
jgi:hypothetical protein